MLARESERLRWISSLTMILASHCCMHKFRFVQLVCVYLQVILLLGKYKSFLPMLPSSQFIIPCFMSNLLLFNSNCCHEGQTDSHACASSFPSVCQCVQVPNPRTITSRQWKKTHHNIFIHRKNDRRNRLAKDTYTPTLLHSSEGSTVRSFKYIIRKQK